MTRIDTIFAIFHDANPTPTTELAYKDLFTLLVAVILSARTTDKSINKITPRLFATYDTPEKILALGLDGLKEHIKTIGLFNNKAKYIIELCEILVTKYNSEVPHNFDTLITLPGIGRKTANVVINCWFGAEAMPVDTHVFRVAQRLGLSDGKTPNSVEKDLMKVIPQQWLKKAHHWLVLHGRYICQSRKPKCEECIVREHCPSRIGI